MSALTHLLDRKPPRLTTAPATRPAAWSFLRKAGELAWGLTSFALFLVLGPFSAIAVVMSLASLAAQQENATEPDPLSR